VALREIPLDNEPEQLTFKAFELASTVAELIAIEARKKDANEDFNIQIKALKKSIVRLSGEIREGKRQ
jgi:hypothetical protein